MKPWRQRIKDLGGCHQIPLQRINAEEPAFVVIEISEIERHLALAGRGDFDEAAAQSKAVGSRTKHDAAEQVEDDIRALAARRRTNLGRQVRRADDQPLRDPVNGRIRTRRAPVRADDPGAEASRNLGCGPPTPPPAPTSSIVSPARSPAASMPHQAAM
jgi:hypothetical protein